MKTDANLNMMINLTPTNSKLNFNLIYLKNKY